MEGELSPPKAPPSMSSSQGSKISAESQHMTPLPTSAAPEAIDEPADTMDDEVTQPSEEGKLTFGRRLFRGLTGQGKKKSKGKRG